MTRVFIAVGSNINPEKNVREVLHLLARELMITAISTFYRTEAEGRREQPAFYNGVIQVETDLSPTELKYSVLRRLEDLLNRKRTQDKYAPRTIDLDLLLYDDLVDGNSDPVLPDPQINLQPFRAVPLYELSPDLILPDSGQTIREIAESFAHHRMEPLLEFTQCLKEEIEYG